MEEQIKLRDTKLRQSSSAWQVVILWPKRSVTRRIYLGLCTLADFYRKMDTFLQTWVGSIFVKWKTAKRGKDRYTQVHTCPTPRIDVNCATPST